MVRFWGVAFGLSPPAFQYLLCLDTPNFLLRTMIVFSKGLETYLKWLNMQTLLLIHVKIKFRLKFRKQTTVGRRPGLLVSDSSVVCRIIYKNFLKSV